MHAFPLRVWKKRHAGQRLDRAEATDDEESGPESKGGGGEKGEGARAARLGAFLGGLPRTHQPPLLSLFSQTPLLAYHPSVYILSGSCSQLGFAQLGTRIAATTSKAVGCPFFSLNPRAGPTHFRPERKRTVPTETQPQAGRRAPWRSQARLPFLQNQRDVPTRLFLVYPSLSECPFCLTSDSNNATPLEAHLSSFAWPPTPSPLPA